MIDTFSIFTKGGIILFNKSFVPLKGAPVDSLIRKVLIEERGSDSTYTEGTYNMKWTLCNEFELVFVVVYQKILQLLYIDELLEKVKTEFTAMLKRLPTSQHTGVYPCEVFHDTFDQIRTQAEEKGNTRRAAARAPRKFEDSKKFATTKAANDPTAAKQSKKTEEVVDSSSDNDDDDDTGGEGSADEDVAKKIEMMRQQKLGGKGRGRGGAGSKKASKEEVASPTKEEKRVKEKRTWGGESNKRGTKSLDYSNKDESISDVVSTGSAVALGSSVNLDAKFDDEEDERVERNVQEQKGLFGAFSNLTGSKPLTVETLQPALAKFKEGLMAKNVASEIAEKLCDSVANSMNGKKPGTFQSIAGMIKESLEESLTNILTPKRQIDVLREAAEANRQKRPYVVVFIGVNGVGKSTSLSKVAFFLKQSGHSVMLCACDTFRSGAVEQLRVHGQCLGVPVFERGYGKDAAAIAAEGIQFAKTKGIDCVLVDTAGRMQDNAPLMIALSKLVNTNNPDLVLFVGEALVGNDAVDQLSKFNQCLQDLASAKVPRTIDGIVLSKFDTIDDKVGAALSLVYTCGQPIVFVGVGQTYTDLRRLNVQSVVKSLLR